MDKVRRIKVREEHKDQREILSSKIGSLIAELTRWEKKYGPNATLWIDDDGVANISWETSRWETDKELKERVESLERAAKIEAEYGTQCEILDSIRSRGGAQAEPRPSDFGAEINAMILERKLIPVTQYQRRGVPADVIKLVSEQTASGLSTGIGHDEKIGWFVLVTAGQGPVLVWAEKAEVK